MSANITKNILKTSKNALRSVMLAWTLVATLVLSVGSLAADQAQYYYDELGRLVGVVNGQGDAAVYQYDEVGNLLKIDRFTSTGGNVGIFLFTPSSSLVNKPVEIRGFGFTSPPSSNTVNFNGTVASVVSGTSGSLIVTVPSTATTGPVTVTNTNGVATSSQAFTVLVPPIITGIDPLRVAQSVTTRGTVNGFNLKTASAVQFAQAGLTATILAGATDDKLPITVTIGASVPIGLYPFSVTTPSGTAQSGTVTVEVRPPQPGFNTSKVLTINMPLNTTVPAESAPTGPSFDVSPVTSVEMP